MTIDKKSLGIIGIMVLAFWLSFIFVDGTFSASSESAATATPAVQETVPTDDVNPDSLAGQLEINDVTLSDTHSAASLASTMPMGSGATVNMQDVNERQSTLQDIHVLQSIYDQSKDVKVLVSLIQRLATNYQFVDANKYLQLLMKQPGYEKMLDMNVVLYVLLHSDTISLQDAAGIDFILPLVTQYRNAGLLTKDDEVFYQ